MKVAIIGAGAIGLLFSAYLNKKNLPNTLYCRTKDQARILHKEGLILLQAGSLYESNVEAYAFENFRGDEDVFIVTVKQYDIDNVLDKLKDLKGKRILFLQNGMGHIEKIAEMQNKLHIYLGVVEHGALRHSMHKVEHTGIGRIKVAPFHSQDVMIEDVINNFSCPQFPFVIEKDWYPMVVKKLVVNAVINPLTAVHKVKNGELLQMPFLDDLKSLFLEVSETLGIQQQDEYWREVLQICNNTSENYSSMLTDLIEKRETEVDAILGFLLKEADIKHKVVPHIRYLFNRIHGMQKERK